MLQTPLRKLMTYLIERHIENLHFNRHKDAIFYFYRSGATMQKLLASLLLHSSWAEDVSGAHLHIRACLCGLFVRSYCHFVPVALGESITLIAIWQSVFMTGDHGALPSMEEKHIDLSPSDLRWLSNLALRTDGHVECSSAELGIDCVDVNGRVIFFRVHLVHPSCHPFFPVIWSQNSLTPL